MNYLRLWGEHIIMELSETEPEPELEPEPEPLESSEPEPEPEPLQDFSGSASLLYSVHLCTYSHPWFLASLFDF